MNGDTLTANSNVLIRLPSSTLRMIKLAPNTTIHLGKFGSFFANDIIGKPYGYTYEIKEDKHVEMVYSSEGLFPASNVDGDRDEEDEDGEQGEEGDENGNNEDEEMDVDSQDSASDAREGKKSRHEQKLATNETTTDDPSVQRLTMTDIEIMKKTKSGEQIIKQVIKSHTAFEKKSIYSKEKYTRRKQQKFIRRFTPCSVGSSELIEYFQYKDHHRILELTSESLGLIMSLANVHPGGNYIVVDETGGLVTGAMLERIYTGDGEEDDGGSILFVHENEHANLDLLKYMNFSDEVLDKKVSAINLLQLYYPEEEEDVKVLTEETLMKMKSSRRGQYYRRLARHKQLEIIFENIRLGRYDGLIIASTLEMSPLLQRLIPAVDGSRQLVLYHTAKEPLVPVAHELMADLRVLAPTILETRVRKYQVFPGRTHPEMTSKSGGGYVLWGTRVLPSVVRAGGKKRYKKPQQKKPVTDVEGNAAELSDGKAAAKRALGEQQDATAAKKLKTNGDVRDSAE
ncbi:Gcd10p family-domain-containing protein [Limtongia smithiae]|uniref:Gcd10p family-domain-containing protein n=1 Tax=Limtongia smithiae TaxID=1125753 RepID=UPI0034CD2343